MTSMHIARTGINVLTPGKSGEMMRTPALSDKEPAEMVQNCSPRESGPRKLFSEMSKSSRKGSYMTRVGIDRKEVG